MKFIIFPFFCLLFSIATFAQSNLDKGQIITELGGTSCSFLYKNSAGKSIQNLHSQNTFFVETGYQRKWGTKALIHGKITFNQYGVKGSNEKYNNYFEWQMRYLGVCLGAERELLKPSAYHLNLKFGLEPQFLLKGTQTINNQVYNINGVEQFDDPFLFFKIGLGFSYCFDEFTAVSMRYIYGYGLPMGKQADNEVLHLSTQSISLGLHVSLKRCDYCYTRKYKNSNNNTL